jgi:very-short-patch-repair endonuclease
MPVAKPQARRIVKTARRLRSEETSAEELLWHELRNRRLDGWKFRRQMPIGGRIADFACVEAKLTVEIDGKQHLEMPLADRGRTTEIEAAGFLELRFSNDEVRGRLSWVVEEIRRALDTARTRQMRAQFPRLDQKP